MTTETQLIQTLTRRQLSEQSKPTQTLSLPSSSRTTIDALQRLCSMKNQAQFTPHKAETWAAALSIFDPRDAVRAILEQGLTEDAFPDLAKIIIRCERIRRERDGTVPQGGVTQVSSAVVSKIASVFNLEIR